MADRALLGREDLLTTLGTRGILRVCRRAEQREHDRERECAHLVDLLESRTSLSLAQGIVVTESGGPSSEPKAGGSLSQLSWCDDRIVQVGKKHCAGGKSTCLCVKISARSGKRC
jgi:hypothetical protein